MKKQQREERMQQRNDERELYAKQEAAIETFVDQCRKDMVNADFTHWHTEACATAGNSFHVFEHLLHGLSQNTVAISPPLRKSIDAVLAAHQINRQRLEILATLRYDSYWRTQYGYD